MCAEDTDRKRKKRGLHKWINAKVNYGEGSTPVASGEGNRWKETPMYEFKETVRTWTRKGTIWIINAPPGRFPKKGRIVGKQVNVEQKKDGGKNQLLKVAQLRPDPLLLSQPTRSHYTNPVFPPTSNLDPTTIWLVVMADGRWVIKWSAHSTSFWEAQQFRVKELSHWKKEKRRIKMKQGTWENPLKLGKVQFDEE